MNINLLLQYMNMIRYCNCNCTARRVANQNLLIFSPVLSCYLTIMFIKYSMEDFHCHPVERYQHLDISTEYVFFPDM